MEIGQDPICGAQQKGDTFWRKIYNYFHEHKHLGEHPFESNRSENSITKRWQFIVEQCTLFTASYDHVKKRQVSGLGVGDLVFQALAWFKAAHKGKSFNMVHCWTAVKDCPKWQELYKSWSNNGGPQSNVFDLEGGTASATTHELRPRGRNTSKAEAKRDAASQVVVETIKTFLANKEVSTEKRGSTGIKKKAVDSYVVIETKRLAIEEMNARAKAKEADNKQKELEIALLGEEAKIIAIPITKDMDPIVCSWLEKKKMIHDRDI
jgi:hypothetical protein